MPTLYRNLKPAKPRKIVHRAVRIISGLCGENAGTIAITVDSVTTGYEVWRLDADLGSAWQLTKIADPEDCFPANIYHVTLCGEESCCDCQGWRFNGGCRHVSALTALSERRAL